MKKQQVQFQQHQQQQEEAATALNQQQNQQTREFSTAEEMLRCDAAQTELPEEIEERLAESIQREGGETNSGGGWWKSLFV